VEVPETPAKSILTRMLIWAREPFMWPIKARDISRIRSMDVPLDIRTPTRVKNGIASRG
jgi:hypothetical protein